MFQDTSLNLYFLQFVFAFVYKFCFIGYYSKLDGYRKKVRQNIEKEKEITSNIEEYIKDKEKNSIKYNSEEKRITRCMKEIEINAAKLELVRKFVEKLEELKEKM